MTLYEEIGEERLRKIVSLFYERVYHSTIIGELFQTDRDIVEEKQFMFLCQFLGGPSYYSHKYGHPRMRMRHLPHRITEKEMEEWLRLMHLAIMEVIVESDLARRLYACFPQVAAHMVNS